MPSSLFMEHAQRFAENIGDGEIKAQITHYLRQNEFPGPIITFVGAEGRGKSTLLSKIVHTSTSSEALVQFAGAADWKRTVGELRVQGSVFHKIGSDKTEADKAEADAVGDALLCDAPPFGAADRDKADHDNKADHDKTVAALLAITDLAVMAVQITQPAGADEVAFMRAHLTDVPSVLVLTKCDQVDEEDFQDGLTTALENYGDFPWQAVLLSNKDGYLGKFTTGDKVTTSSKVTTGDKVQQKFEPQSFELQSFEAWWRQESQGCAEKARTVHLERLQQRWRDQARAFLEAKEQENAPKLEEVRRTITESASIMEARRLQDELIAGVNILPDRALSLYKSQMSSLRRDIDQVTHGFTDRIKAGQGVGHDEMEQALAAVYGERDREARLFVKDKIKPDLDGLEQKARRYVELIAAVDKVATTDDTQGSNRQSQDRAGIPKGPAAAPKGLAVAPFGQETSVPLEGEFDLTLPDKLRFAAVPTISGLGTGVLLLTVVGATFLAPLAPILALVGAGVMGIGSLGSVSEASHQRRAGKVREAIGRQFGEQERRLEQHFYSDWKQIRDTLRDSVAASKRRLNILLLHQSPAQDDALVQKHRALTSNLKMIEGLRRDLQWLEEHAQARKLIASEKE